MNKKTLWIVAGVAILVVLVALVSRKGPSGPSTQESGAPISGAPTTAPIPGAKPSGGKSSTAASSVKIVAPASGDEWVIGKIHDVKWSKAAGYPGGIALLDAAGKNTVGWIHQNLGSSQTYFSWDTREIFLSRTSPLKKEVGTGTYVVKVVFDGPVQAAVSTSFSVVNPSEAKAATQTATIQNYVLTPATITAAKGDKVVFTNNDSVTHQLRIANLSPYSIPPGTSLTFDTSIFFPGPYQIYSDLYASLKGTLVVK